MTVIALLSMSSGVERALAFIAGWILATGEIALHGQDFHSRHTSPSRAASVAEVVLGCLLVAVAARAYRRPQHEPKGQSQPKWLARVDRSHPVVEVFVGAIMLSYALTLTAAAETAKAHVGALDGVAAGLVFAATSVLTIATPLAVVAVAPERSGAVLATWRNWVLSHSRPIMLIALMLIGAAVVARASYDLAS